MSYFIESLKELNKVFTLSAQAQIAIKEKIIREIEEIMASSSPAKEGVKS